MTGSESVLGFVHRRASRLSCRRRYHSNPDEPRFAFALAFPEQQVFYGQLVGRKPERRRRRMQDRGSDRGFVRMDPRIVPRHRELRRCNVLPGRHHRFLQPLGRGFPNQIGTDRQGFGFGRRLNVSTKPHLLGDHFQLGSHAERRRGLQRRVGQYRFRRREYRLRLRRGSVLLYRHQGRNVLLSRRELHFLNVHFVRLVLELHLWRPPQRLRKIMQVSEHDHRV